MNSAANAVTISSLSTAPDLIGVATVSITHFAGQAWPVPPSCRTGGVCDCQFAGSAGFDLTVSAGDTFSAIWTLH